MNIEQKIEDMLFAALARLKQENDLHLSMEAESPIEQLLRGAFLARTIHTTHWLTMKYWPAARILDFEEVQRFRESTMDDWQIHVWPQIKIGPYRVDFLAIISIKDSFDKETSREYLAIECDGHEFHEKTKEQAARDKARDRYLLGRHIPVMRFTGSEIWRAPEECVGEIVRYFEEKVMPEARVA